MNNRYYRLIAAALLVTTLAGCSFYQSIGRSPGAYLVPVKGSDFVHIDDSDWNAGSHALVYFYRVDSQWAADELEAPSIYVDNRQIFNIRGNSYTWLELEPGVRRISARRPLMGLEGIGRFNLDLIADGEISLEAGQIYYFRYNELTQPERRHPSLSADHPFANGDLQLVPRDQAMQRQELPSVRFLQSQFLAPNRAARSLVRQNQDDDFKRDMAELRQARKDELAQLAANGAYRPARWYWPFASAKPPLATDQLIREREAAYARLVTSRR